MHRPKILVVDDETDIVDLISYNLKKEGFDVYPAYDGETAVEEIKKQHFDFLILDIMLPGMTGLELCQFIRNDPEKRYLPIIMLTAKSEDVDKIVGLEMGADDYITKPFSPRELIARVKAVMRRCSVKNTDENVIYINGLVINKENYSVYKNNSPLQLRSTEFKILLYLVERKGKVFSREQLLNALWKDTAYVEPRTIDVHIRRLRAQIEDDPANPRFIKTKRGIGYYIDAGI